jgi:hypothetical protein
MGHERKRDTGKETGDPSPRTRKQLFAARMDELEKGKKNPKNKRSMVSENQVPKSKVDMSDDHGDTASRRESIDKALRKAQSTGNYYMTSKDKGMGVGVRTDTKGTAKYKLGGQVGYPGDVRGDNGRGKTY